MRKAYGFTIVELLIVIVVIAILAAITITTYSGIQQRSRDVARQSDVTTIQKALELYRMDNGRFPVEVPNPGNSTWEISSDPGFLSSLSSYTSNTSFKDPRHGTAGNLGYFYHRFAAGSYGCPTSMGEYYILWVRTMEAQSAPVFKTNGCDSATLLVGTYATDKKTYAVWGF